MIFTHTLYIVVPDALGSENAITLPKSGRTATPLSIMKIQRLVLGLSLWGTQQIALVCPFRGDGTW